MKKNSNVIRASHIGTMLPCYLNDGHNRPGEMLVCATLGGSVKLAVKEMVDGVDWDVMPGNIRAEAIEKALRVAMKDVDMRYIDENGNRVPHGEEPDDRDSEEPMAYFVLSWDARVVKMRMTVDVTFEQCDAYEAKLAMEAAIGQACGRGTIAPEGGKVVEWGATAEEV